MPVCCTCAVHLHLLSIDWSACYALQFYGTINSLYKAISEPLTAFVIPSAMYIWVFRSRDLRDSAQLKPWRRAHPGYSSLVSN